MKTIYNLLDKTIKRFPKNPIYHLTPTSYITYDDFSKEIKKFEYILQKNNIKKGDKCVIISDNSPKTGALLYSMFKRGVIAVPTYLKQRTIDKEHIISETKPKLIFNTGEAIKNYDGIELNHEKICIDTYIHEKLYEENIESSDIATILYTSGTSGKPKGVILTNENIVSNLEAIDKKFNGNLCELSEEDKCVSFLPINHCYGLTCEYLYMTMKGSSMYINKNVLNLKNDFLTYNPTILCAVPRLFQMIYKKMPIQKSTYLLFGGNIVKNLLKQQVFGKNIKHATCGGAPIDKELLKYFYTLNLPIYQGYGSTETSPMITLNSSFENMFGSVGKSLDGVTVKLSSNGEIMVSGLNVSSGYFLNKSDSFVEENGKKWYMTGDLGHFKDNFLFIDGRHSSTYKLSNGKFVNPEELENIICRIPNVVQCMVFSMDGISNSAIIVTNESENKIKNAIDKLKTHIKGYEFPTKLILINEPFDQEFLTQKQSLKRREIFKKFFNS